nr:BRO family protein [uncultured Anaerocolumna sp.]
MKIKTELWADHEIRFVEKDGEWWAVLADIAKALNLRTDKIVARMDKDNLSKVTLDTSGGKQKFSAVNEFGIYEAVFESRKPVAKDFKKWVFNVIRTLRQSSGLEGFQIFRMLDKDHQKEAMTKLNASLRRPVQVDFIKANTIANKAVSIQHGYPKMVKKDDMTPEMLVDRQPILEDTVNLMGLADKYGLDISVSKTIYNGLTKQKTG